MIFSFFLEDFLGEILQRRNSNLRGGPLKYDCKRKTYVLTSYNLYLDPSYTRIFEKVFSFFDVFKLVSEPAEVESNFMILVALKLGLITEN